MEQLIKIGEANLNYSQALMLLGDGKMVKRQNWSEKTFLFKMSWQSLAANTIVNNIKDIPQSVKDYYQTISGNTDIYISSNLCFKESNDDILTGWHPSSEEFTAKDWMEVKVCQI